MSEFDFGIIDPDTKSGVDLAADLNAWRDALNSNHSAAARPAYLPAGATWVQEVSPTIWHLHLFDGAVDHLLLSVNPTAGGVLDVNPFFRNAANINAGVLAAARIPQASLADAKGGTNNTKFMTALRVAEAIAELTKLERDQAPKLSAVLDTNANIIQESIGTAQAVATTVTPPTDGNIFHLIAGTGPIAGFTNGPVGQRHTIIPDVVVTLTNSPTLVIEGAADYTTVAGTSFEIIQDTATVVRVKVPPTSGGTTLKAILLDEKASNVAGQAHSANVWTTHDLNTEAYDPDGLISITTNKFTPVNDGYIRAYDTKRDSHINRLYDVTNSVVVQKGIGVLGAAGGNPMAMVSGAVVGGNEYRIEFIHNVAIGTAQNAAGTETEVYLYLEYYA